MASKSKSEYNYSVKFKDYDYGAISVKATNPTNAISKAMSCVEQNAEHHLYYFDKLDIQKVADRKDSNVCVECRTYRNKKRCTYRNYYFCLDWLLGTKNLSDLSKMIKCNDKKYLPYIKKLSTCRYWAVRKLVAENGYFLESFIHDDVEDVRIEVAKRGFGLEQMIEDENGSIRFYVASYGVGLNKLVHDTDEMVRKQVARQGYGLDILYKDTSAYVREEVAKQGKFLKELVADKDELVRLEVAKQGYGLSVLLFDSSPKVVEKAKEMLLLRKQQEPLAK